MLSVVTQDTLAATLGEEGLSLLDSVGGVPPPLAAVLADFTLVAGVCDDGILANVAHGADAGNWAQGGADAAAA